MFSTLKPTRCRLFLYACGSLIFSGIGKADTGVVFDETRLKNRGLNENLSTYFSQAARFMPGSQKVQLNVNGDSLGQVEAKFNQDGQLCFDAAFLALAGLRSIDKYEEDTCPNYQQGSPDTVVTLSPEQWRVDLVVPQEALQSRDSLDLRGVETGGTSASLNYQAQTTANRYSGSTNRSTLSTLEAGINTHDWLFRSHHILSGHGESWSHNTLYSYVQHTFVPLQRIFQAGEINASQSLLAVPSITGAQLFTDSGLTGQGSGIEVRGLAQSEQARVEVRQGGRVIATTIVPAGPFTLTDVPATTRNLPLEVSVTEQNGQVFAFTVPAADLQQLTNQPIGWSVAMGSVSSDAVGEEPNPWLLTASQGWRMSGHSTLDGSALLSPDYQASAVAINYFPNPRIALSAQGTVATEQYTQNQGAKGNLSANINTSEATSINAAISESTSGYREMLDALNQSDIYSNGSYSLGGSWTHPMIGNLSLNYSLSRLQGQSGYPQSLNLNWSKTLQVVNQRNINLSAYWQHQSSTNNNTSATRNEDIFYFQVSFPLGGQRIAASVRNQGNQTFSRLQTSGQVNEDMGYSLSAGRAMHSGDNTFSGSLSNNLHYTQLNTFANNSGQSIGYGASLNGGLAVNREGLLFSPYPIQDTYGVVSLNARKAGVKMSTPQGTVWTDYRGKALLPGLQPWKTSRIEVDVNSLPQDVDLTNGTQHVRAGRGAVSFIDVEMSSTRRVLLTIRMPDGGLLPKGRAVMDQDNNYVTNTLENGQVFLNQTGNDDVLYVVDDLGQRTCELYFHLPDVAKAGGLYEEINGECR